MACRTAGAVKHHMLEQVKIAGQEQVGRTVENEFDLWAQIDLADQLLEERAERNLLASRLLLSRFGASEYQQ
jgi:hypothetical protein